MEIICSNCKQPQIDNKLHYCTFCFQSFSEVNPQNHKNIAHNSEPKRLNDISVSATLKLTDDGHIITFGLKPLGQLIHDNLLKVIFFELVLVPILVVANGVLDVAIPFLFRVRIGYLSLIIITFMMVNTLVLIPLLRAKKLVMNESTGDYFYKNKSQIKKGKLSEFKKILVVKKIKRVPQGRYSREYTLTSWEVSIQLTSGEKIILHQFTHTDDGKESQRLAASWNLDSSEDGKSVIKAILSSSMEKDIFNTFWADTGQDVRNMVMQLSQRLHLEIELAGSGKFHQVS